MPRPVRLVACGLAVGLALAVAWAAQGAAQGVEHGAAPAYGPAAPAAYPAGAAPGGVAVADLDGDGHADVAVTLGDENKVGVLLGRGDGTLGPVAKYATGGQGPIAVAVGDVNRDGRPDLVVANAQGSQGGGTIAVLLGQAGGGFAPAVTYSTVSTGDVGSNPLGLVLADADGDGILDVLTADDTSGDISVLHGNGDGTFGAATTVSAGAGADAIAATTSGGALYVAVADSGTDVQAGADPTSSGSVAVYRVTPPAVPGIGAPTFTETSSTGVGAQPSAVALTDVDGDGVPDLVTADGGSADAAVAHGLGGGTFDPAVLHPVGRLPVGLAVTDVDGDGHPDLLVLSESGNAVTVLSGPTFTARQDFPTGRTPLGIATGDLDGDQRPDVVTSAFSDSTVDVLLDRPAPVVSAAPSPAAAAPRQAPVASAAAVAPAAPTSAPASALTAAAPDTSPSIAPVPTARASTAPPAGPSTSHGHQGAVPPRSAARAYEAQLAGPTDTTVGAIARDGLLALLLLALFQLPTALVNETLKSSSGVVAAWFGRTRRVGARAAGLLEHDRLPPAASVLAYAAVSSVVYAFIEPTFRFDLSSVALVVGLLAALVVATAIKIAPMAWSLHRAGVRAAPRLFPAYVLLAAVCVGVSRLGGLHPGIVVGAVIGLAAGREADRRLEGRAVAWTAGVVLAVTLAAWCARASLVSAVGPADSFRSAALGVALTTLVVAGVELLSIGMLPLRFFDGSRLFAWSRPVWGAYALTGAFLFVHVLVRPGAADGRPTVRIWPLVAFFLVYLVLAFAFWAWFRRLAVVAGRSGATGAREAAARVEPPLPAPARPRPSPTRSRVVAAPARARPVEAERLPVTVD